MDEGFLFDYTELTLVVYSVGAGYRWDINLRGDSQKIKSHRFRHEPDLNPEPRGLQHGACCNHCAIGKYPENGLDS